MYIKDVEWRGGGGKIKYMNDLYINWSYARFYLINVELEMT